MSELLNVDEKSTSLERNYLAIAAIALLVGTLIAASTILVYHYLVAKRDAFRIAVVDISEVMDIKQLQLTQAAMDKNLDDTGRGKLYDDVTNFSEQVEKALAELQSECQCTLVVRAAVIKGNAPDLTEALKLKLGMSGIDPIRLAKQVAASNTRRDEDGQ